jgi:hypothetical protein
MNVAAMRDKKSFWTSMLGVLTGIAAVIAAVGSIVATHSYMSSSPH